MSDKVWNRYPCFCFLKLIILICDFSTYVICNFFASETMEELTEINTDQINVGNPFPGSLKISIAFPLIDFIRLLISTE